MTACCMCPLHPVTLPWHWMVSNCACSLSSCECWWINWNWTLVKLNSSLLGMNNSGANISLYFLWSFLVSKVALQSLLGILGVIFDINFTFRSQISAVCSSCFYHNLICSVFAVTLIWIVQNYWQMFLCLAVSIIAVQSCCALYTLTSPTLTCSESTGLYCIVLYCIVLYCRPVLRQLPPYTCSVPLLSSFHWLPVKFRIVFKICLLTYKTLHEQEPGYRHFMLAPSSPSCSLRSNKVWKCWPEFGF